MKSTPFPSQNILLIGATGYVGRVVAERLLEHGHRVVALTRGGTTPDLPHAAESRTGDLRHPDSLTSAVTGDIDAVVNLATPSGDRRTDVAATEALLTPLRGTGRTILYTSGAWVLGNTAGGTVHEDAPTRPLAIVGYRPEIERQVLAAGADRVRALVLRPGVVHGGGLGIPSLLVDLAAELGAAPVFGQVPPHWPMVHVDDLADLLVAALAKAPGGSILHAIAERAVDTAELARAAAVAAGVTSVQAWPIEEARARLGTDFADALACDQSVSGDRTARMLGWSPRSLGAVDDLLSAAYRRRDVA